MARRLLVILMLLMAAAGTAEFRIPRWSPAFGPRRAAPGDPFSCIRNHALGPPFDLGTAAAIYLGNTNSCIAGYDFAPDNTYYQFCIPSWVAVTDDGTILSGEAAMDHAALSPRTAISGFVRLLNRRLGEHAVKREMELVPYKFTEKDGWAAIQVETYGHVKVFSIDELAGVLVSELRHKAESLLGRELSHAVIAVPCHLNYNGRDDLVFSAGRQRGKREVKAIDHPIAAAAAYHHHTKHGDGKAVLVFHLSGRTSDATLFKFINGTARFIDGRSDVFLGGDDFTARIVDYMVELIKQRHQWDVREDKKALLRLMLACEHAKKALSDHEETQVHVDSLVAGVSFSAPLTRAKLEELNGDLFDRAVGLVDLAVMGVWEPRDESRRDMVDEVILVGGSTRIPKVRQLVKDYFHGREPNSRKGLQPEDTVVRGAAILTLPKAARYIDECSEYYWE